MLHNAVKKETIVPYSTNIKNMHLFIWLHQVLVAACRIFPLQHVNSVLVCAIEFPDQRLNSGPQPWECRVLATELPGKSQSANIFLKFALKLKISNSSLHEH